MRVQFSRYLASAISSDRAADKFGSSDEDDDEEPAWLGGSRFNPSDVDDFSLSEASASIPTKKLQFGFEDRFDTVGKGVFRRSESPESDDEDADWGPFAAESTSPATARDAFDDFKPTVQSSFPVAFPPSTFAGDTLGTSPSDGFDSSFGSDNFTSVQGDDDDDFGDFEGVSTSPQTMKPLPLSPDPLALDDFDFTEESRTVFSTPPPPPLESSFGSPSPTSPTRSSRASSSTPTHVPPRSSFSSSPSSLTSPSILADRATSDEAELGPSMHATAHLTDDGMVEATVDGKIVKVPADEVRYFCAFVESS